MTQRTAIAAAQSVFLDRWGEPDQVFQFDATGVKPGREPQLEKLLILHWSAGGESSLTRFGTVGMSSRPMRGVLHRAELCFRILGDIRADDMPPFVRFLANLSVHPFVHQTGFDWGHTLKLGTAPPGFPDCRAVLFHSALPGDDVDAFPSSEAPIRLLNVIPLTEGEVALQKEKGTPALVSYFDRQHIDVFRPRASV